MNKRTEFAEEFSKNIHVFRYGIDKKEVCNVSQVMGFFNNWGSRSKFFDLENKLADALKSVEKAEELCKQYRKALNTETSNTVVSIPIFVAEAVDSIPDHNSAYEAIELIRMKVEEYPDDNQDWVKVYNWLFSEESVEHQNLFVKAFLFEYNFEDSNFYKNKLTNNWLTKNDKKGFYEVESIEDARPLEDSEVEGKIEGYEKVKWGNDTLQ